MEHRGEQLTLALDLPAPRRPRPDRRTIVVTAVRVLVAGVLAVLLAGVALVVVPYRSSIAGVDITVTATAVPSKRGITVDSSLGSLVFRDVTAVPIGLHVAPQIDLMAVVMPEEDLQIGWDIDPCVETVNASASPPRRDCGGVLSAPGDDPFPDRAVELQVRAGLLGGYEVSTTHRVLGLEPFH